MFQGVHFSQVRYIYILISHDKPVRVTETLISKETTIF